MQVTVSTTLFSGAAMRTVQVDSAEPPRPSVTRTVMVTVAGGVTPVLS